MGLLGNNDLIAKLPDTLLSEFIVALLLHMVLDIFVCSCVKSGYSRKIISITWKQMPLLLVSPGHQQQWNWLGEGPICAGKPPVPSQF